MAERRESTAISGYMEGSKTSFEQALLVLPPKSHLRVVQAFYIKPLAQLADRGAIFDPKQKDPRRFFKTDLCRGVISVTSNTGNCNSEFLSLTTNHIDMLLICCVSSTLTFVYIIFAKEYLGLLSFCPIVLHVFAPQRFQSHPLC